MKRRRSVPMTWALSARQTAGAALAGAPKAGAAARIARCPRSHETPHRSCGTRPRDALYALSYKTAASVHFPTPLHAPELAHGLYVPATSACYGVSSASGDSGPVGAPRPAGGTGVGNFVQPPATISTGLDHLYCLQPASARRRAPRGPGRGGLGEHWVYIAAVIIWTQLGPVAGNERDSSRKIPDARLHTTETETETIDNILLGEYGGAALSVRPGVTDARKYWFVRSH